MAPSARFPYAPPVRTLRPYPPPGEYPPPVTLPGIVDGVAIADERPIAPALQPQPGAPSNVNLNPVPSARTLRPYPPPVPSTLYPPPVPSACALCLCPLPVYALRLCPPPEPSACALRQYYARTLLPYFTPQNRHNQLELKQVCQLKLKQV